MAEAGLAAILEEIRGRSEQPVLHPGALPIANADVRGLMESAGDVPRLLAALDGVLELHSLTGYVRRWARCRKHRDFGYGYAVTAACPDCALIQRDGCCGRCRDEHGDPAKPEDCEIRQAISRALLGEEANCG